MQTFLPLPNFRQSAKCLDNRRLGKQRVECKQMLLCLGVPIGLHAAGPTKWQNHPAILMWASHKTALLVYAILVCREWKARGFQDKLLDEFVTAYDCQRPTIVKNRYPKWFGLPAFHASHRSNLLRKDFEYYSRHGWRESTDLPYLWPITKDIS